LKELGAKGEKLTSEALFDALQTKKNVQDIFGEFEQSKKKLQEIKLKETQRMEEYEKQLEKIRSQKDKLIRQLDEVETVNADASTFYNRTLLTLTEMVKSEDNKELNDSINEFKKMIKKGVRIDVLKDSFQQMKKSAMGMGETAQAKDPEKSKSRFPLPKFLQTDSPEGSKKQLEITYLNLFRETFQEIINELGLELGEDYLKRLERIGKKIRDAENIDEFETLRRDILSLIQEYIERVCTEREKAAKLIADVINRLSAVESYFSDSRQYVADTRNANAEFGRDLASHMDDLKNHVEFSKTLEELRDAVVDKLHAIMVAIKDKSSQDKVREKNAEKQVEDLVQTLNQLKQEVITAQNRAKVLEQELLKDPLTGAYNRRAYEKSMHNELHRYLRYQRTFSVLLFDVDHFKIINDKYGHTVGDKCLKEIILRAGRVLRENDVLARFGGEEFIALLPETELKGANEVAEKLRKAIENIEFVHREEIIKITVSIGLTQVSPEDSEINTLFDRMDMAMYEAKKAGRNRVVVK